MSVKPSNGYMGQGSMTGCQAARLAFWAAASGGLLYYVMRMRKKVRLGAAVLSKSWFSEFSCMWPGQAFSLKIEKKLYEGKSDYQHIQVFDCGSVWGKVLVLDGVIQCTEKDECAYQEMMSHVPLVSHPNPRKVLVIGGGDGGVLREVGRHRTVEEIHICEIDEKVIEVSKKFLPTMACGFDDARVRVHIQDGFEYLKTHKGEFDVIIVDSSDPIGPAEVLFKEPFYKAAADALTTSGILCCQGECMWLHIDVIKNVKNFASKLFNKVDYGFISIPTYPCGTIGMLCCSKDSKYACSKPQREAEQDVLAAVKYYNTEIHKAAFVLPSFVQRALQ